MLASGGRASIGTCATLRPVHGGKAAAKWTGVPVRSSLDCGEHRVGHLASERSGWWRFRRVPRLHSANASRPWRRSALTPPALTTARGRPAAYAPAVVARRDPAAPRQSDPYPPSATPDRRANALRDDHSAPLHSAPRPASERSVPGAPRLALRSERKSRERRAQRADRASPASPADRDRQRKSAVRAALLPSTPAGARDASRRHTLCTPLGGIAACLPARSCVRLKLGVHEDAETKVDQGPPGYGVHACACRNANRPWKPRGRREIRRSCIIRARRMPARSRW